MYNTFDAPSGEVCIARREVSNSPLQALSLLNDAVFIEPSQAIGKQLAQEDASDEARASEVFRRLMVRPPEKDELAMLVAFAGKERERFVNHESAAIKVAGDKSGNVVERATWTAVARAVMNLDESVTKD